MNRNLEKHLENENTFQTLKKTTLKKLILFFGKP